MLAPSAASARPDDDGSGPPAPAAGGSGMSTDGAPVDEFDPAAADASTPTRWLARLVDWWWSAIAALAIASAAVVTVVRLLLPEIGTQRAAIEDWIEALVGRPARVGAITASWDGWAPRIGVTALALLDPSAREPLLQFDEASIEVAPLGSLLARGLKPARLVMSGVALTVIRHRDGHFSIAGMPPPRSPILGWLLDQDKFTVTRAEVTLIDEAGGASFALSDIVLNVRARPGGGTLLTTYVDLPRAIGGRLALEIAASRSPLDADWMGSVALRLEDIDGAFLAQHLEVPAGALPPSRFNLRAWSAWADGRLQHATFDLDAASAAGGALFGSRGRLERAADGWRLAATDIDIAGQQTTAPRVSVAWQRADGGAVARLALAAEHLPLVPLAALLGALAPDAGETLNGLAANVHGGRLDALALAWQRGDGTPRYFIDATLAGIDLAAHARLPALAGLDARVVLRHAEGWLGFVGAHCRLSADERLVTPLEIEALDGVVRWRNGNDGAVALESPGLHGRLGATLLSARGRATVPANGAPDLDFELGFATAEGARLHELVPQGVLPPKGEHWVRTVIEEGRIEAGAIDVAGKLAPLAEMAAAGGIKARAEVRDARLRYSQHWPPAVGLDGQLTIDGRAVEFTVARGTVEGADVSGAVIALPDLFTRQRMVNISGTARGPASSALAIVEHSPLARSRAARLRELEIDGDLEVSLDLGIGLYPDGPREVLGQARFSGNRVHSLLHHLVLDDLTGTVGFTRGDWYGEDLRARFDGSAVGLIVNGGLDDPNYDSEIRLTGTSSVDAVMRQLARFAPAVHGWLAGHAARHALSGEMPWKAVLSVPSAAGAGDALPSRLSFESSLRGLAIELPWPLGKVAAESRPLRIETAISEHVPVATRIDLGDGLAVDMSASRGDDGRPHLERLEVLLGSTAPSFSGKPGIRVSGYVPELPLERWLRALARDVPAGAAPRPADAALTPRFDVQVARLEVLGRDLADVRLRGTRDAAFWRVQVDSADAAGTVDMPHDIAAAPLKLAFERLHLGAARRRRGAGDDDSTDPRRLPAIEMEATSFRFGDLDLGRTGIRTRKRDDGQHIERVTCVSDTFSATAEGDWLVSDGTRGSHFTIAVDSPRLDGLLGRFGFKDSGVRGGRTRIDIDASWAGNPSDFALARMNGTFKLHVTQGRLVDVEPGSGRLFGLLSLQTLPRRLLFDFNDLFEKGFAFDVIDGTFELESGNAYTSGLLMEGPAARIDISGRTGLGRKDYDQRVVVTPALSSTLPVAGALFGPIGAGAGAVYFLGQKMFKSIPNQIDRLLSRQYSVTGTWDKPVVERI